MINLKKMSGYFSTVQSSYINIGFLHPANLTHAAIYLLKYYLSAPGKILFIHALNFPNLSSYIKTDIFLVWCNILLSANFLATEFLRGFCK